MTGRGKGEAKRHREVFRDKFHGVTKPVIRSFARYSGEKRINGLSYDERRHKFRVFLKNVIRDLVIYALGHPMRKTVNAMDVVKAIKRQGRTLRAAGG